eukprot:CAMPEP_0176099036 /NCGR_PEP_ID=MMETSP0120_2-20121206/49663_1 /TAXON_ID=160619 /ORGANISM="Kryptoperidinium foliaceum, Strain CCMP 1326" /LENGTH=628 /DNA_ID=CAMNT_0017433059 /DNA_START=312 /DNA_END=2195 /DNA_ORIENTATION=+
MQPHSAEHPSHSGSSSPDNVSDGQVIVRNPGIHDVLLGRGGGTNNHIGNVKFRELVSDHKMRYIDASKVDKPKVARDVVEIWRKLDPPGRFLTRQDDTRKGPGSIRDKNVVWVEVDEKEARKKASQCLRERTEDIKPYLAKLRDEQDKATEEGVSIVKEKMNGRKNSPSAPDTAGSTDVKGKPMHARSSSEGISKSSDHGKIRRGSLGSGGNSAGVPMPGTNPAVRSQTTGSMPMSSAAPRDIDVHGMMSADEQLLRDAYSAVEREYSGTSFAAMQMQQQQLLSQQQFMQQQLNNMRYGMVKPSNQMSMMNGMGGYQGMSVQSNEHLMQQQQYLAQEQQRILREQERLVRQEHMIARQQAMMEEKAKMLARQQMASQMNPMGSSPPVVQPPNVHVPVSSNHGHSHDMGPGNFSQEVHTVHTPTGTGDFEPLPLGDDSMGPPDKQPSSQNSSLHSKSISTASSMAQQRKRMPDHDHHPKSSFMEKKLPSAMASDKGASHAPHQNTTADLSGHLSEYRKTLESYIANNNSDSFPSLDMHDERTEERTSRTVNGIATDEWIEEQLLNDMDEPTSPKERPGFKRSSSKKSVMSVSTSNHDSMSFAFSDMEESLDDISRANDSSRRRAGRSMS